MHFMYEVSCLVWQEVDAIFSKLISQNNCAVSPLIWRSYFHESMDVFGVGFQEGTHGNVFFSQTL